MSGSMSDNDWRFGILNCCLRSYAAWPEHRKGVDTVINHYDAIQFWVGYEKNRPGALVEVKGVELVDVCDEETKEPIVYEHNGNEYTMTEIDYHLGKVIEKMNC